MAIVILIGYMGSGKSTVARTLATKMGYPALDLDEVIEIRAQQSIPDIFEKKGELYFRKAEREALHSVLTNADSVILATGGGTPCYYGNIDFMNEKGVTVFLRASVPTLKERLRHSSNRPLLAEQTEEEQAEFIAKHLFERNTFYQRAQHTVSVDGKTPEAIAEEILGKLVN